MDLATTQSPPPQAGGARVDGIRDALFAQLALAEAVDSGHPSGRQSVLNFRDRIPN